MEWEQVAVAPNQLTAEMWVEILAEEGIVARIRPGDVVSFLGISTMACGLLVPSANAEAAREILGEIEEGEDAEGAEAQATEEEEEAER